MFSRAIFSFRLFSVALAVAAGSGIAPAHAVPLSAGTTIAVSYDRPFYILPDLTATLDLTVESMTANQIVLGVAVDNTTSPWFLTSRLTDLRWTTNSLATGAADTSPDYHVAITSTSIDLDSRYWHGLRTSQSDLFALTLVGDFDDATVDFSNFTATFETIIGSFDATGTVTAVGGSGGGLTSSPGGSVPEPGTLTILGGALLATFAYRLARTPPARAVRRAR